MKLAFLIADGMGDYPLKELEGKTPLEVANTPNMDRLAKTGKIGLCRTIPQGMEPGSDIANMAILGFDPSLYHTGRGPIEAAALKVPVDENDIIFRMNLVTVSEFSENGVMIDYSAAHITDEEAKNIISFLKKNLEDDTWKIIAGFQYRHLLIRKDGKDTSLENTKINPPHDILDQSIRNDYFQYKNNKQLFDIIIRAKKLLKENFPESKANCIWPWGQGKRLKLPDFFKTYGLKGAVISAVDLIKGLGYASNMEIIDVEGATGLVDTNYKGKAEAAIEFLKQKDFIFLHLEGPDECGHAGDIKCKIKAIERFDKYIVGPICNFLESKKGACLICCDHLTPVYKRTHVSDPVPILFINFNAPINKTDQKFSEINAKKSDLFIERGEDLIKWILEQIK
ncbi:cofactor-independent phosphoglycerate mutase [Desulfothermus naphthae]